MNGAFKPTDRSDPTAGVDPREVDAAMIQGLYQRVRPLIVANFGALVLLTIALWGRTDALALTAWATTLAAWTMLRFVLARGYMRRERPLGETWRWTLAFALGSTVAGCLWGTAVIFVGDLGTDSAKLVTAFLMAALSAAAIAGYTNSLLAFAGFVTPALLPYGLRLINLTGSPNVVIVLFVIFWGVLLWVMARHLNEGFRESIVLSLRNGNLAERLRIERDRAEAASEAKSRFLGHMSHELRTPLNAVIGYADMMAHRVLGPLGNAAYEGYARDIADSGRHMLSMVQGILDVSALESDVLEMNMRPTDLGGVIAAASADIQGWAEAKKITLTSALPDALPKVYGNADRLRQVAGIVIENAVKYTARGGHVRIAAKSQEPGWVQLDVVDNGAGMSPETVAAVQFPFAQMDNQDHLVRTPDAAERPGRTGPRLNLPLAKLLAEAHGGDLAIESAPGVGTTVSIRLPTAPASKEEEAEDEGRAPPAERTVAKMVGHKEAAGL